MNTFLQIDGSILLWIQENLRTDSLNSFFTFITSLGDGGWFWIALALALCIHPRTRRVGFLALCSMLICALITNVALKNIIARPRPYTRLQDLTILIPRPNDYSFPSGHTTASFASALLYLRALPKKRYAIPAVILAILIAFSRLYLGVHYPTDILGGLLVALLGSQLTYYLYLRRTLNRQK